MKGTDYIKTYLDETALIATKIDQKAVAGVVKILTSARAKKGRLFFLGVGGSAANASHAVNDFRKIAHVESYAPTDNVSELTARVNDDGWESVFVRWLEGSRLNSRDIVFVLSVGGGNKEKSVSMNIVNALDYAKKKKARIVGIISRDGGHTAKLADACVLIPVVNPNNVTAHAEGWQAVVWHAIVFHPDLRVVEGKWESVQKKN